MTESRFRSETEALPSCETDCGKRGRAATPHSESQEEETLGLRTFRRLTWTLMGDPFWDCPSPIMYVAIDSESEIPKLLFRRHSGKELLEMRNREKVKNSGLDSLIREIEGLHRRA